ncbi:hypothetical protein [Sphingobium chungangianum]
MNVQPEGGRDGLGFPRLHHWLIAAGGLFVMTLTIPVIAGFI